MSRVPDILKTKEEYVLKLSSNYLGAFRYQELGAHTLSTIYYLWKRFRTSREQPEIAPKHI